MCVLGKLVDDCQSFVRESLTKTSRDGVARGLTIDREISRTGFQPVFCKQTGWKPFYTPQVIWLKAANAWTIMSKRAMPRQIVLQASKGAGLFIDVI